MRTSGTRPRTPAGLQLGRAVLPFSCRSSSIFLATPTSPVVVPSYWALSFRLILLGPSYQETRLTSGSDGTSRFPPGCGIIYSCHSAGEKRDDLCCIATCWL